MQKPTLAVGVLRRRAGPLFHALALSSFIMTLLILPTDANDLGVDVKISQVDRDDDRRIPVEDIGSNDPQIKKLVEAAEDMDRHERQIPEEFVRDWVNYEIYSDQKTDCQVRDRACHAAADESTFCTSFLNGAIDGCVAGANANLLEIAANVAARSKSSNSLKSRNRNHAVIRGRLEQPWGDEDDPRHPYLEERRQFFRRLRIPEVQNNGAVWRNDEVSKEVRRVRCETGICDAVVLNGWVYAFEEGRVGRLQYAAGPLSLEQPGEKVTELEVRFVRAKRFGHRFDHAGQVRGRQFGGTRDVVNIWPQGAVSATMGMYRMAENYAARVLKKCAELGHKLKLQARVEFDYAEQRGGEFPFRPVGGRYSIQRADHEDDEVKCTLEEAGALYDEDQPNIRPAVTFPFRNSINEE